MAYPTIFPLFCKPRVRGCTITRAWVCTVMRAWTLYHSTCLVQVRSCLSFLKLFTDMRSEAGHETCSSSWWWDRNLNLCHANAFFLSFCIVPSNRNKYSPKNFNYKEYVVSTEYNRYVRIKSDKCQKILQTLFTALADIWSFGKNGMTNGTKISYICLPFVT